MGGGLFNFNWVPFEITANLQGQISNFDQLDDVQGLDIKDLDTDTFCKLLLFGNSKLNILSNRIIIEATIIFIDKTKRFEWVVPYELKVFNSAGSPILLQNE